MLFAVGWLIGSRSSGLTPTIATEMVLFAFIAGQVGIFLKLEEKR